MKIITNTKDLRWWLWFVTLIFIISALGGWVTGYYIVIGLSALQVLYFFLQEKSLTTFPSQIRIVYFLYSLFGLWNEMRFILYIVLLVGTFMVVFFGRCSIALMLKYMPWNKEREPSLY